MDTNRLTDPAAHFEHDRWTAAVMGLGYVGLPLVLDLVRAGLDVIGFDIDPARVTTLQNGSSHIDDVSDEALQKAIGEGVIFTSDAQRLRQADGIFICVPSPLGRNRQPDLTYIERACATVTEVARAGQLIALESTSYPGTTDDYVVPAIQKAGLAIDRDVWVAFAPERVSPGDTSRTSDIPKVVGGVTELSGQVAEAAYARFASSVHRVSTARAAEMTKLLENTYRAVNIGLINEMAQLAHEIDLDIWEVIDAAETKPFGFQAFYPGPGVGGHCIPLDPQYLAWRAREASFATRFIDTAEQVNIKMPLYTVSRISELLNSHGFPVFGTRILGMGIAYKPGVADDRESASLQVLSELSKRGAHVSVLDPVIGDRRIGEHGFIPVGIEEDISSYQLTVVLTDHNTIDYARIAREASLIFDTRGVFRRLGIEGRHIHRL